MKDKYKAIRLKDWWEGEIRNVRAKFKEYTRRQIDEELESAETTVDQDQEADDAIYCHLYGPCNKCKEKD